MASTRGARRNSTLLWCRMGALLATVLWLMAPISVAHGAETLSEAQARCTQKLGPGAVAQVMYRHDQAPPASLGEFDGLVDRAASKKILAREFTAGSSRRMDVLVAAAHPQTSDV